MYLNALASRNTEAFFSAKYIHANKGVYVDA